MIGAEVAEPPATSRLRDAREAAPVAVLRALAAALAVAALGQVPPSLVNVAGGGLAFPTQWRVGWLYTMAGHAVAIRASGASGSLESVGGGVAAMRLGLLTIAALGVAMLVMGARATARRVDDVGVRRLVAGASIAVPYALVLGLVNAEVALTLRSAGVFVPAETTLASPRWEGFVLPAAWALLAGTAGGWSTSRLWHRVPVRAVRAGGAAAAWALGLAFVALLAAAALRPEGLERYSVEVWSGGPQRAALYAGHQALLLPNQSAWMLAPAMGGCVSISAGDAAHDLVCLDRIPRGADPATWLLTELGRIEGEPPTAPMPAVVWLLVAVPTAAIVLAFRHLGRLGSTIGRSAALGVLGGVVFAVLVTAVALAGSLWLTTGAGAQARAVRLGPDPVSTAALALGWGVLGGAIVSAATPGWRRLSRRVRPR